MYGTKLVEYWSFWHDGVTHTFDVEEVVNDRSFKIHEYVWRAKRCYEVTSVERRDCHTKVVCKQVNCCDRAELVES